MARSIWDVDGTAGGAPTPGRRLRPGAPSPAGPVQGFEPCPPGPGFLPYQPSRPRSRYGWDRRRDKALGLAIVTGLIAIIIAALLTSGPDRPDGAPRPVVLSASPSSDAADAPTRATSEWYEGTAGTRAALGSAAALVRRFISTNDGRSLEPACADFATQVVRARRHPGAPDLEAQQLWSDGLSFYATAASACGQLFDGTRLGVGILLERTTTALDGAERVWSKLARLATASPSPRP